MQGGEFRGPRPPAGNLIDEGPQGTGPCGEGKCGASSIREQTQKAEGLREKGIDCECWTIGGCAVVGSCAATCWSDSNWGSAGTS